MKKMPAKIANTSSCALLKPMSPVVAYDVWSEGDHPRGEGGQFGAGASRAAATKHPVGSEAHGHHIAAAEHHEAAEKATDPTAKAEHLEMAKKRTSQAEEAEKKTLKPMPKKAAYNATAVNKAIGSSKQKIGGKEAKAIHRLLKGRH